MKIIHSIILFIVLVGSDLLIGFAGHYSGATGGDFTMDGFIDYVTHLNVADLTLVFVIAIVILLFLHFIWRRW